MCKKKIIEFMINEYVQIMQIINVCKKSGKQKAQAICKKAKSLKNKYEKILFRMKQIDLSFFLLQNNFNQTKNTKQVANLSNFALRCFENNLKSFEALLGLKMNGLLFNEFEIMFVEKFA